MDTKHIATIDGRLDIPFDSERLDALLDEAGIDVLVATSKHNVQYLLGGYRFFFFACMDAIGESRYLPILIYQKGHPERSAYIGNALEVYERELGRFWTPHVETSTWGSLDAIERAISILRALPGKKRSIGVEPAFLPADAHGALAEAMEGMTIVGANNALERLRARKTARELEYLREGSQRVVASMMAVFAAARPGMSKHDLVAMLRREETARDLQFEYCLVTAGGDLNRAPSSRRLEPGDILSLDSGANYRGYIGDLCRMGTLAEPDSELVELLAEIDAIQQAARLPIRAGARGGDIFDHAEAQLARSPNRHCIDFLAHGMGLITHEAPQLTGRGPLPYPGRDADRPLEEDMVVSIETTLQHPRRGFIKLEDTVAVTLEGCEGFGDEGRGWNPSDAC